MLAKQLTFLAVADAAGVVLGARAHHIDQPGRRPADTHGVMCRRGTARACPARGPARGVGSLNEGAGSFDNQCRLVEHQVRSVRDRQITDECEDAEIWLLVVQSCRTARKY